MLHRIFWPVYVILAITVLLFSTGAMGQEKLKEGDTLTGVVAVCEAHSDAATLIGLVTKYGTSTATGWMEDPDNTCALLPVTFKVGAVEVSGMKDRRGVEWSIVGVTIDEKPHFAVMMSSSLASQTSY